MKTTSLLLLLISVVSFSISSFAQTTVEPETPKAEKPKVPLSDRIFFGGNFGFTFGSITNIEIAPQVGYKITPAWSAGIGGRYAYYKDNYYYFYQTNMYGGLLFTRYLVYKGLFLDAEFEANNFEVYKVVDPIFGIYNLERMWVPSLLLGGGYSQPIGDRSAFFVSILYDVLQHKYSPYYRVPVIRAGFGFGI